MNRIIRWLKEHGIAYSYSESGNSKIIDIILEKDCIWINHYDEPIKYDKSIRVVQNTYKIYKAYETYQHNMTATLRISGRSSDIIDVLEERILKF